MSFTLIRSRAVERQRRTVITSGVAVTRKFLYSHDNYASSSSSSCSCSSAFVTTFSTSSYPYPYPYPYSSPLLLLIPQHHRCHHLSMNNYQRLRQQIQQQQQQIQKRSYLFIPMSWPELKERAERWLEKTESRIVNVRLLNRKRLQLRRQQEQEQEHHQLGNNNNNNNNNQELGLEPAAPAVAPAVPAAAVATTTINNNSKIRIKYQGWKIRRKQQYQIWKIKRKDQYVHWKSKRRDQYVHWKSRRRDQYVRWKNNRIEKNNDYIYQRGTGGGGGGGGGVWGRKNILLEEYSKPEWFDKKSGRPLTSRDSTGQRYVNPWQSQSTNGVQSISTILQWQCQRFIRTLRRSLALPLLLSSSSSSTTATTTATTTSTSTSTSRSSSSTSDNNNNNNDNNISPLLSQTIQPLPLLNPKHPESNELYMTWIGHSTCLFQMHSGGGMRGQSQIEHQSGQNNNNNNNNNNSKSSSSYWSILTDPMFSTRASPYKHWIGIPRDVQPAYTIQDILNHQQQQETTKEASIDICCITHDHYDHMDMISVRELKDHVQLWVVPLGIADWLVERCFINRKQIVELEWWQNVRIIRKRTTNTINGRSVVAVVVIDDDYENANNDDNDNDNDNDNEVLTITCCPASHWSGRTIFDRNKRLWCSFAMSLSSTSTSPSNSLSSSSSSFDESKSSLLSNPTTTKTTTTIDTNKKLFNIFFCGDTSYPNNFPLFHQIGDALGPFDLSCIPIGAYLPKEMNKDAHCDPYEALKIHNDIQSKHSIAIHWGSFNLGEEPLYEPPQLLYDAIKKQEQEKKNKKQKQERVDNDNVDNGDISAVASRTSIKFDILRHGESRKII